MQLTDYSTGGDQDDDQEEDPGLGEQLGAGSLLERYINVSNVYYDSLLFYRSCINGYRVRVEIGIEGDDE